MPRRSLGCLHPYPELTAGQQSYPSPNRSCSAAWETFKTTHTSNSADSKTIKPFSLSPKVANSRTQGKDTWIRQAWVKLFYMLSKASLICFLRTLQARGGIFMLSMFFSSIVLTNINYRRSNNSTVIGTQKQEIQLWLDSFCTMQSYLLICK